MIISIKITGPERKRDETLNYKRERRRKERMDTGTSRNKMRRGGLRQKSRKNT